METVDNTGTSDARYVVISYAYDAVGNRLSVGDNFGVTVTSTYDARDQLASRTWTGGGIDPVRVEFDYDPRGERTETRRYADATGTQQIGRSTFGYDADGRLTDIEHRDALDAVFADYDRLFDLAGQLTQDSHHGETTGYTYDEAGQLTSADHTGQADEGYTYDENGNRISGSNVIGPNNRLLSDGTYNYAYDNEGNLITKTEIATGTVTTFTYDYRNRLTKVERRDSAGTLVSEVDFTYDVFDRRIAKTVDADGQGPTAPETTHFVYNGFHVWADFHDDGTIAVRYMYGDRIDEIIARFRPGEGTAWYLADALGTVRDIADATGAVIEHIDYDSFGNIIGETNAAAGDRYKFTGREYDPELALYYYRGRYYDPITGRFISQDPIGFAAGDANLYRYVGNTPTIYVDPLGLAETVEDATFEGANNDKKSTYARLYVACVMREYFKAVAQSFLFGGSGILDPMDMAEIFADCQREAASGSPGSASLKNLNSNDAIGNFGVYNIHINGSIYKFGKADLGRVTKSSGLPTRLHQQVRKLEKVFGKGNVVGKVVDKLGRITTAAAKKAEHARILDSFKKTGFVPLGNWKSFKP